MIEITDIPNRRVNDIKMDIIKQLRNKLQISFIAIFIVIIGYWLILIELQNMNKEIMESQELILKLLSKEVNKSDYSNFKNSLVSR